MNYSTTIQLGDKVRTTYDKNVSGLVVDFDNAPDGVIIVFEDDSGKKFGEYDFNLEWVD